MTETSDGPGEVSLSVLEMLPEGVVVLDADWVYRYVNPAGAAFLGTTVGALLGQDYRELYPEADGTAFQQVYARVMQTQVAEVIDEHYPPWDKYFRNTVLPWHGGIAVFFSDVTDERKAQAEQAKELEVLQQVVDHADALIVLKDLEGRYVMVNKAVAEFLGREPEDMIGRQTREFFPPELADAMEASERKVVATERARHVEQVVELQPGRPRVLWTVRFPAYDADGVLSGVGAIYTDVTQRRDTEARLADALREAAETVALLETLQSSSPVGFAFVDRDFRFVRVNDAMAALNGLSVEAHLGNHVRDVIPTLWPQIEPVYVQVLETGQSITEFELGGETPARPGEKRDWLVSFYPVRPVGEPEPIGIGVIAHEVTAHRRLEAQLRQAQKMEAVGQLAGGIAHDFNNVLAAVTLTAELCLQQVPDGPVRDGLARILSTAHSASGLTKQLLVFSRQQRVSPVPSTSVLRSRASARSSPAPWATTSGSRSTCSRCRRCCSTRASSSRSCSTSPSTHATRCPAAARSPSRRRSSSWPRRTSRVVRPGCAPKATTCGPGGTSSCGSATTVPGCRRTCATARPSRSSRRSRGRGRAWVSRPSTASCGRPAAG